MFLNSNMFRSDNNKINFVINGIPYSGMYSLYEIYNQENKNFLNISLKDNIPANINFHVTLFVIYHSTI